MSDGPRERPRVVRLVVEQSDVERADDDATHAANPRPRHRGDCGPLECPHCAARVLMRLGYDGAGELSIACPECSGRVMPGGAHEWAAWDSVAASIATAAYPALLNHCRPCAFAGCGHHLFLDVTDSGASIRMNFPSKEVWELEETCALDVADRDGATLDEVGQTINITRERVRQLIEQALKQCKKVTSPLFKSSIDVEDVNALPDLHHALEDASD